MRKGKTPWYGLLWIVIWTIALGWLLNGGMFNLRESVGLVLMWAVLVGATIYLMVNRLRVRPNRQSRPVTGAASPPPLNALCPCGSGKKYKRCCGAGG